MALQSRLGIHAQWLNRNPFNYRDHFIAARQNIVAKHWEKNGSFLVYSDSNFFIEVALLRNIGVI
jgi:hypothetical protein